MRFTPWWLKMCIIVLCAGEPDQFEREIAVHVSPVVRIGNVNEGHLPVAGQLETARELSFEIGEAIARCGGAAHVACERNLELASVRQQ